MVIVRGNGHQHIPHFYIQYIPRNTHTVFALLCFVVVIHWLIFPYPASLLHWHCGNLTIAPVPAKQPWWIWINTSCEFIMNDCITTTKQSTTKPCACFLGYTVHGDSCAGGRYQRQGQVITPQYLWGVITFIFPWYLHLIHKSSYVLYIVCMRTFVIFQGQSGMKWCKMQTNRRFISSDDTLLSPFI